MARYGADGSYYKAGLIGSGSGVKAYIFKVGSRRVVHDARHADGGVLRRRQRSASSLSGGSLQLFFNNALVDSATDPTPLAAGSAGLSGTAGSTFDNFSAQ